MTRTTPHDGSEVVQLEEEADALVADLPNHHSGRKARTILTGTVMRSTLIALAEGIELSEHDSPSAATLQVIRGRVTLLSGDRAWSLSAGQVMPIPPTRHSLRADTDAAVLLTVALH
jgi:quercetin dioxygenase-like cupin family protein